jgi:CRISPR/Cas system CSM-associated protein Csm5 (group 7 of RAMP superfamily)
MQKITSTAGLKEAIQLLEAEKVASAKLLKEQFVDTYESFKPASLLRSTLNDISSSPNLIENILGTALGLGAGYLSRTILPGVTAMKFGKLISPVLQLGVTNFVAKQSGNIRSAAEVMLLRIFRKKRVEIRKP